MSLLTRLLPWRRKATEGAYRPGPYPLADGWLSEVAGRYLNWWQMGYAPQPYGDTSAMVEACISAYSQTVAMCPGDHWRLKPDGGRERVTNSSLARILRRPNDYQSMSDLMLNATRRLYERGEAFAVTIRNAREEPAELHLMRNGTALVAADGSIFYNLSGNEVADRRFDFSAPIPARDVLHVRLHTPRHPLKGESPIVATALDLAMSGAALNQQIAYYLNQARPSFMLETEEKLSREQAEDLRARWHEQTQGVNAGGTPVLSWGLKAKPVVASPKDGQLAELLKMTDQSIALAFRMPLQALGVGDTPFASTEALMSAWKASGLGFALNHIEEAFGLLFRLKGQPDEYLEFDTSALMRSNFKERMEGWAIATKAGLTINEFRNSEGYASKEYGDEPRVQQQVVPLSYGAAMQPSQPTPPGPTEAVTEPQVDSNDDTGPDSQRAISAFRASYDRHAALVD